ncbi:MULTISPECIES: long-chain fatty acid--CoA ligase [Caldilinea]|jgi:acyl-CoA synthetase (AMP-forming)/AMP-acid ligase II|uniref:Putative fatty-acid--CoA ligase n=1 Tax=Caldilinea aerophila (strain DSM 14535 / JCM 11387 / NBRC 104270 / STL-6-O1) TaxID=926550 RepID=I0I8A7_CALAS|nr:MULTISPECIES: long-chain fatty acid--CoA ligase [Caldilinea]MBO9393805.1 long-chain fatty acid--CoA ligase [Caldilinea sp.]BAM01495.1 putative fatty-acid--CoA ligase [Caldilinea aerophila DSM 14535 = NBRC 104270]GIV72834.1 MAG: long-chain-fatty-acid--CoA ligase [Caldilinea sp.]
MNGLMMNWQLTIDKILEHGNRLYAHKRITTVQPDGSLFRYTYADLYRRSRRLAKALVKLGVEPGDRIGTFAWNNYQHLELYYAVPGAGAVCHTLNIRLFPDQLAYIVNHAEDKIVFVDGTLLPLYQKVAPLTPGVQMYVLFNAPREAKDALPNVFFYEDLIEASDEDFAWRSTDENMAMGMCYTSGTTGEPKGALYSHRSMFLHTMGENAANALGVRESDVVLPVVPQFHAMAWGLPYACIASGAEIILPGPHLRPQALADLIANERVTIAAGVPTIWNGLYHELKQNPRDISCIRALVVGGSAMPRSLIKAYESELGVNVLHAWGMTEMSPLGTVSIPLKAHQALDDEARWDIKARQGYPILGVEMRIVDEVGRELPWDGKTMGELQVRGPWIIRQYFKREPTPDSFTADGWFRTGDVATITSEGYMTITDRTKDLVKSGGEWISTVELENALIDHPKVLEAAVIAIPDEKWSERPLACVVRTKEGWDLTAEELQAYLATRVARFWVPERIVFIDEVPKTSVGKFDKKELRRWFAEGRLK